MISSELRINVCSSSGTEGSSMIKDISTPEVNPFGIHGGARYWSVMAEELAMIEKTCHC